MPFIDTSDGDGADRHSCSQFDEVPPVACDVEEDGDLAIRLFARLPDEFDACGDQPRVGRIKVVDAQEKADAAGELFAHDGGLRLAVGARQQQSGFGVRRADHDPALRAPVVGHRSRVFGELETEDVDKKPDRGVVVMDDKRDEMKVGHDGILPRPIRYDLEVSSLMRSGPREHDIDVLRAQVTELERVLDERRAEVNRVRADLAGFKIRYRSEVGLLHEELDDLERAIDEAELGETARRVAGLSDQASMPADARIDVAPRYTSDAVRKLFRDVAKAIHPDLAGDDDARDRRHSLMVEANHAYAVGDEERLRSILQAWENSPEAVQGSDAEAMRERLLRRIAQIEEQLNVHAAEHAALRDSALWRLKTMVDEAATRGQDLVAEMVTRLQRDIMIARNRLDAIQWRP